METVNAIYMEKPSEISIEMPLRNEGYLLKRKVIRELGEIINSYGNLINYTKHSKIVFLFIVEVAPRNLTPLVDSLGHIGTMKKDLSVETYSHDYLRKKKTSLKIHLRFN